MSRFTENALEQGPDTTTGLTLHSDYDDAKTAAQAGDAMTLTAAYEAAKTAAQAGDEMDLVDAPNTTAITAIQSGLATESESGVLEKILKADVVIDDGETPYELVFKEAGTETELFTKELYEVDGTNITSETQIIGQRLEPGT